MIRKYKRDMLKKELGTNNISEEFHKRYGSKSNVTKNDLKLKARLMKKIRKLAHLKARNKKTRNGGE